jgi:hypothetical protein
MSQARRGRLQRQRDGGKGERLKTHQLMPVRLANCAAECDWIPFLERGPMLTSPILTSLRLLNTRGAMERRRAFSAVRVSGSLVHNASQERRSETGVTDDIEQEFLRFDDPYAIAVAGFPPAVRVKR